MITVFKNITDTNNPYFTTPEIVLKHIKTGRWKDMVEKARTYEIKAERDKIKRNLPSICWSGKFSARRNDALISHSGLVCVDFDHIEDLDNFKKRICADQYVYIAFVSPSGDGLKVIVKIPDAISTHEASCSALTEYFNDEKLDEFKDVARVCYASFDPEAYINHESKIFNKIKTTTVTTTKFYPKERLTETNEIYERIVTWLNKSDSYGDGNKHKYLVKLAAACLRFGIPELDTASRLYFEFANKASKVDRKDIDKIVSRVYSNYSSNACSAHFEVDGKSVYTVSKQEIRDEVFDIDMNSKDIIYLDNVRDSMIEGFKTGKARGATTYYPLFDSHWTWRKKDVTFLGGIGNMGKTIMLNTLCLLRAINNDWRFAIFSPEQDPPDDFYNDLIHTYIGKSTEPFHDNQMSEKEYEMGMAFIKDHFFYIYPESASPTPDYINSCFEFAIKKHHVDVVVIDPFNQLDNDWRKYGRDDLYISEFLSKCKRFAQQYDVAYFIIGHPKGNLEKKEGNYESPDVYDYSGGAMWNNKCDNILCYHRPFAATDPENTLCLFISQKIKKRKLTGVPGKLAMQFDIKSNRFVQQDGYNPFTKKEVITEQTINLDRFIEPERDLWDGTMGEEAPY